ncbi:MAG: hypothetical protein FJX75_21770 [Armatimonadetes bacterium]|nr:hypothetical protein [Armatimonadota bacterium]
MFASTRNSRDGKRGERLTRRAVQGLCARYYRKAGVTGRAHTLRHTAATLSRRHGADPRQVQAVLRHTDPTITAQTTLASHGAKGNVVLGMPGDVQWLTMDDVGLRLLRAVGRGREVRTLALSGPSSPATTLSAPPALWGQ